MAPVVTLLVDWEDTGDFSGTYDEVHPVDTSPITRKRGMSADFSAEMIGELEFELGKESLTDVVSGGFLKPGKQVHMSATTGYAAAVRSLGPVAYWRLGEPSGTTAADDIGSLDGTYVNTPTLAVTGAINDTDTAVTFTAASSEHVIIADNAALDLADVWSVTAWVKVTAVTSAAARHIVSKGDNAYGVRVNTSGNVEITRANDHVAVASSTLLTTGWHHVVATKSGTALGIYIDGVNRTGTVLNSSATADNSRVLMIGADPTNDAGSTHREYMNGTLDEVALFDYALGADQAADLFNAGSIEGATEALFYGTVERITHNTDAGVDTVTFTCYDPLRRFAETDIRVPANNYGAHTARTMRRAVLEDLERGDRNLIVNPSFETNVAHWDGLTITRTGSDAAPGGGSFYGAVVATLADQWIYVRPDLTPILFENEVYRFSVYLKVASGTQTWKVGFGPLIDIVPGTAYERSFTVTTSWQRFSVTYQVPATETASASDLVGWIKSTASGTVRVDAAAITRGSALHAYADTGTGRWPSWVGNGDFEGGNGIDGWYDGWSNLIANPSFETNTTGWSTAADGFIAVGGGAPTIARATTDAVYGTAHMSVIWSALDEVVVKGVRNAISGTFTAGITHDFGLWLKRINGALGGWQIGIGSSGTPADFVQVSHTFAGSGWEFITGSWTPSSNRTDAHFFIRSTADEVAQRSIRVDGVHVIRRGGWSNPTTLYADTGVSGTGLVPPTSRVIIGNFGKYGDQAIQVVTPATSMSGVVYDFSHFGPRFVAGQPYTVSLWAYRSGGTIPYEVGISANEGDGTFEEATTTGTVSSNTWTQITLTWTPAADYDSSEVMGVMLWFAQTSATSRTIYIDGVRIIPGSSADDFEMPHWSLDMQPGGENDDRYLSTAALSGGAGGALSQLNGLTLTRHWIRPEMSAPYYTYVSEDRLTYAAKSPVQTYDEDDHVEAFTGIEIDRESVVNVVSVTHAGGTEYYSDSDSVGDGTTGYGPRPAVINGAEFFPDRTVPDIVGPALVARYAEPLMRPQMVVRNDWPRQLEVDLSDDIEVTIAMHAIDHEFVVLSEELVISGAGTEWVSTYQLEEYPYA